MTKYQKAPICCKFLKTGLFMDIKNDIPICKMRKYTNTKIQIHKYTNTAYDEVPERPNMWYIFEKRIVQGYQKWYSHVSNVQIHKYKYTNTQIQHMTKCQKDPTCSIFLKKRIVQGYQKLYSHVSNAQMQSKVPERPNMWYIFEKAIVQGCLLSLAQLYKV